MKTVCVFLGASHGDHPDYVKAAHKLGYEIARRNLHLIYGGGRFGLMGALADSALKEGGKVTGVITHHLYNIEAHAGVSNMLRVNTMQERKELMIKLADGFIALPGGLGTLEEITEAWNGFKLRLHHKPVGILNVNGFYDMLIEFMTQVVRTGFLNQPMDELISVHKDPLALLDALAYQYSSRSAQQENSMEAEMVTSS